MFSIRRKVFFIVVEIVLISFIVGGALFLTRTFHLRVDLTENRRYSLTDFTKELLARLKDPITVSLYMGGDLPPEFRYLRDEIKYVLEEYQAYGGKNFYFEFIDPNEIAPSHRELNRLFENLSRKGLNINSFPYYEKGERRQIFIITGGFVRYGMNEVPVDFLKSPHASSPFAGLARSVSQIEYEMTLALMRLMKTGICNVGILEHPSSASDLELDGFMKEISSLYDVKKISTFELRETKILNVLCIIAPDSAFSEQDKVIIDQFVMKGGNLLITVNGVKANMDSLARNNSMLVEPFSTGLEDLLMTWGIKVENAVIEDMNCLPVPIVVGQVGGRPVTDMIPWRYFPIMLPHSSSFQHPVSKNIDPVLFRFPSPVDTLSRRGLRFAVLFSSSPYSRVMRAPFLLDINNMRRKPDPALFTASHIPSAVIVEGILPSAYASYQAFYSFPEPLLKQSIKPVKVVVIGDGDIFSNQVVWSERRPLPLGYDRYTGQMFGNARFLSSVMNYLCGDTALLQMKNKDIQVYPLNGVIINRYERHIKAINVIAPLLISSFLISICLLLKRRWR